MKKAVSVKNILRTGSSLPAAVQTEDGGIILVKLSGSGDGAVASVTEWIASHVGILAGLPLLMPSLVRIESGLANTTDDGELRELIRSSEGINLCFPFLTHASECSAEESLVLGPDIFYYDCFLLNTDRHGRHTNCLVSDEGMFSTDYGVSFLIRGILEGKNYDTNMQILSHMCRSPLRKTSGDWTHIMKMMTCIGKEKTDAIIDSIPDEWLRNLPGKETNPRERLKAGIADACRNTERMSAVLGAVSAIGEFDEEKHKKQQKEQRDAFVRGLKEESRYCKLS